MSVCSVLNSLFRLVNTKLHFLRILLGPLLEMSKIEGIEKRNTFFMIGQTFKSVTLDSYLTRYLKVSKFGKQIFLFSFEPKNEQIFFLISALASKNGSNQKNEGTLLY